MVPNNNDDLSKILCRSHIEVDAEMTNGSFFRENDVESLSGSLIDKLKIAIFSERSDSGWSLSDTIDDD